MKKIKSKLTALILSIGIGCSVVPASNAFAATAPVNSQITQTKKQIVSMADKIDKKVSSIEKITDRIFITSQEIDKNQVHIGNLTKSIGVKESEKKSVEGKLSAQEKLFAERLRENYKNGNLSKIKTLLSSENAADFLLKYEVIKNIAKHDQDLIHTIDALKAELEEKVRNLKDQKEELTKSTEELKAKKVNLANDKKAQESEVESMKGERQKLKNLLKEQEVSLFKDLEGVLTNPLSSEAQVQEALSILDTIQEMVSTPEAVQKGRQLQGEGQNLLAQLKAARQKAEKLAKEKAEAEAKKQAALALQKEKERQAELKRIAELEKQQAAKAAEAKKLKAEEEASKAASLKATQLRAKVEEKNERKVIAKTPTKSTTSARTESSKVETKPETKAKTTSEKYSTNRTFYLSFYTNLPSENGGWTVTATGDTLKYGMVANNVYPFYTKIYLEGYGTMRVMDRGGSDFNSRSRLDVFIPRRSGESSSAYLRRVNNMGRRTARGRVL